MPWRPSRRPRAATAGGPGGSGSAPRSAWSASPASSSARCCSRTPTSPSARSGRRCRSARRSRGGTEVDIPPLGSLHLDSHDGPIHLKVDLGSLDQERTEALIDDPTAISAAGQTAVDDVTNGVLRLGLRALGAAIATRAAARRADLPQHPPGGLVRRAGAGGHRRQPGAWRPAPCGRTRSASRATRACWSTRPRWSVTRGGSRTTTAGTPTSSSSSSATSAGSTPPSRRLPVYEPAGNTTRILHVSDLHLNPAAWGLIRTVVQQFDIDAVVDTGDIVDWGSSAETGYVVDDRRARSAVHLRARQPRLAWPSRPRSPGSATPGCWTTRPTTVDGADHRRHRRPGVHPGQERGRRRRRTPTTASHRCCRRRSAGHDHPRSKDKVGRGAGARPGDGAAAVRRGAAGAGRAPAPA